MYIHRLCLLFSRFVFPGGILRKIPLYFTTDIFRRFRGCQRKKMPEGIFFSTIFTYRSSQNRLPSISMMPSSGTFFPSVRIIIRSYSLMRFSFLVTEWYLISCERKWRENQHTVQGDLVHHRADDPLIREKRRNIRIERAMSISSEKYGLYGVSDCVEYHMMEPSTRSGQYREILAVEYKKGKPKSGDWDALQVLGQILCLEAMHPGVPVSGVLYYDAIRRRVPVEKTEALFASLTSTMAAIRIARAQGDILLPEFSQKCRACSLIDDCAPLEVRSKKEITHYMEVHRP